MNRFLVVLFLGISSFVFSQSSEKYNSDYANFFRAEELFQKKQYAAARKEFRNFVTVFNQPTDPMYIKALYYEGVSALELFNNDAVTLLETFNRNYPESIYKKDVFFRLGKFYYQKKDYSEALSWFNKLSANDLEQEFRDEFFSPHIYDVYGLDENEYRLGIHGFRFFQYLEVNKLFCVFEHSFDTWKPRLFNFFGKFICEIDI